MRFRRWLPLFLALAIVLATFSAGLALSSTSYRIDKNSLEGGGAGGGVMQSTHYQLRTSFSGMNRVSVASGNQEACSGFLCGASSLLVDYIQSYLPFLRRQ